MLAHKVYDVIMLLTTMWAFYALFLSLGTDAEILTHTPLSYKALDWLRDCWQAIQCFYSTQPFPGVSQQVGVTGLGLKGDKSRYSDLGHKKQVEWEEYYICYEYFHYSRSWAFLNKAKK